MASKFTIGPTPHLPINEMGIHPSLFVQEPGSNKAHYRISTLEKAFKRLTKWRILRTSVMFVNAFLGRVKCPCDSVVKNRFRKILKCSYIVHEANIRVKLSIPSNVGASLPN